MAHILKPAIRRNLSRILPFGVIWLVLGQVFLISDWAAVDGLDSIPETAIRLSPSILLFASLAVLSVGLLVGVVELLYLNRLLAARSLGAKLALKTAFYTGFLFVVILITFPIAAAIEMDTHVLDEAIWSRFAEFLTSRTGIGTAVQLTTSLVASLFYAEISEHMGPGVLRQFLTGRYHRPRQEERIFLFSDMKDSTAIAEKLGSDRYFDLLKAYYDTFSEPIVRNGGEVYQYIGDEIVVSWKPETGLPGARAIKAAAAMQKALQERGYWFEAEFGIRPSFRAGMQMGTVTTGEIGALKKNIVFTGDVLNQTARIQALCKELGEDLLIGDVLADALRDQGVPLKPMGTHVLRGKQDAVSIHAPDPSSPAASMPAS